GRHGKRSFTLTAAGATELAKNWQACLKPTGDLESVVRGGWVAAQLDKNTALRFLQSAAEQRQHMGKLKKRSAESSRAQVASPLGLYRWMRDLCQGEVLAEEGAAFRRIYETVKA